jgi:hypothetical protein
LSAVGGAVVGIAALESATYIGEDVKSASRRRSIRRDSVNVDGDAVPILGGGSAVVHALPAQAPT